MKSYIERATIVTIELSPREARWLRALCQNPPESSHPLHEEDPKSRSYREQMFHHLNDLSPLA